ncbi:hypothetical protein [Cohnella sp. 56]|uniref:hypothetical protein n=1 Tax=Cohnella sp. 56 TaxID=3113722 RepID=UPI0030EA96A8
METERLQAKRLFMQYGGSTIRMYKAGALETYKAHEVPPALEAEWVREMIGGFAQALSIRDWEAAAALEETARAHKDPQALQQAVRFASRHLMSADSVVKLKHAEHLIGMLKALNGIAGIELSHEAIRTAKVILDDVIAQPLVLDAGHDLASLGLKDKRALNQRAGMLIEALKDLLAGSR